MITDDILQAYQEDTDGRRCRLPTVSKRGMAHKEPPPEPISSVNVNRPITRAEFKGLTNSLKSFYIKHLRDEYGVTAEQIADMLGYSAGYFSKMRTDLNLDGLFVRGSRMSKAQKEKWNEFLHRKDGVHADTLPGNQKETNAALRGFSIHVEGGFCISEIARRLRALIDDGTPCSVRITVDI